MVRKARKTKGRQKQDAQPALVALTFPRIVVESMPRRIADRPVKGSLDDTSFLYRVGVHIANALKEQASGQIIISSALDRWHRLAGLCATFDTGAFGPQLCAKLAELESAPERAARRQANAENDAELKIAADRLREEERLEGVPS